MNTYKVNIINFLQLVADNEALRTYQKEVPFVGVPVEICAQWFDDFYHPQTKEVQEAFSEIELLKLEEFNQIFDKHVSNIPELLEELFKYSGWQEISKAANSILVELEWKDISAKYDNP